MARIALFDPYNGKFTNDLLEWWQSHGHEVQRQTYYNPELVDWADVVWFDTCDNNLLSATNPDQALKDEWKYANRVGAWDMHEVDLSHKKVIVRPIDIEVWQGHHAYDHMWDIVDEVIFLAPHIQQIMMADSRPQQGHFKQHVIPCGVNLDRWTFKERQPGNKVGIVAERWVSKGVDLVIQLALKMPDYEFHWLGKNNDYHWQEAYLQDKVKSKCPNLILEEDYVDDLNAWWEDKNFVLSCSYKETYGYNIAEAMAKGIKPVIHRFYGAEAVWPDITWDSIDEAARMLSVHAPYNSAEYPKYLTDHHLDLESMMRSFEDVINS